MKFKYYRIAKTIDELNIPTFYNPFIDTTTGMTATGQLPVTDFVSPSFTLNPDYKDIIEKMLFDLVSQRYYTSILGTDLVMAGTSLMTSIVRSANNFAARILSIETNLTKLIVNKSKIHKSTNTDVSNETIEDSSTDNISDQATNQIEEEPQTKSLLIKENDTPNAGNNTDLLSDTYLSKSQRNVEDVGVKVINTDLQNVRSIVTGERKSTINNLGLAENNYEIILEDADAQSLSQLLIIITNIYEEWLEYIEAKHLIYTEDFQEN